LAKQGKYPEAKRLYQDVLVAQEARFDKMHPVRAETLTHFGMLAFRSGHRQEGQAMLREAVDIYQKSKDAPALQKARALADLAVVLLQERDYPGAERYYREALPLLRKQS